VFLTKVFLFFYYKLTTNIIDTKRKEKKGGGGGGGKESGIGTFKSSITRVLGFCAFRKHSEPKSSSKKLLSTVRQTEKDCNFANRYVGACWAVVVVAAATWHSNCIPSIG
jgi:hypothetical protein